MNDEPLHPGATEMYGTVFGSDGEAATARLAAGIAAVAERGPRPVNTHPSGGEQLWINGRLLLRQRLDLPSNSAAWRGDTLLAARLDQHSGGTRPGRAARLLDQQAKRVAVGLDR